MKKGNFVWDPWMALVILTIIEIFRAAKGYRYYGHGLGFGLTVIIPLLILLPLMIGYELHHICYLRRGEGQKNWIYYGHLILLSVFLISLALLLLDNCTRLI